MDKSHDSVVAKLLDRADDGEAAAVDELLSFHRERLKRMVDVHLDPRVGGRGDASDVVQEALVDAAAHLPDYLARHREIPFYVWLRKLAWQRLIKFHERHVGARKRTVLREQPPWAGTDQSSLGRLARELTASGLSPSGNVVQDEQWHEVLNALGRLPVADREILVLRHLEQLSPAEIAAALDLSVAAVNMRHLRAIVRIRTILEPGSA